MDIEKIKELVNFIEESSFDEFEYSEGDMSIFFRKQTSQPSEIATVLGRQEASTDAEKDPDEEEDDGFEYILSPMVGTFYSAPSPDAPAFVRVGDRVHADDPVCIIEAMKLMNEIECPYDAEIISVVVSNEQKVEYGQPLFKIRKL